jgi:multidrug efflux pump subunit AcrA (membrane-fusion protein)
MRKSALNAPATARARLGAAALAATILGAAHLATAVSCGGAAPPPMRPTEISVRTAVAEARTLRRSKTYPGITASVRPVDLSARVQGFLETQHVKDGERVTAGTLIYSIDDAPFRAAAASAFAERTRAEAQLASALASTRQAEAQLAQVRAQVAGAQAAHDLAARDVERNRPLVATGAISKQAFDQYESKFVEAESQLEAAEASVETADAQRESAYSQTQIAEAQIAAAAAQLDTAGRWWALATRSRSTRWSRRTRCGSSSARARRSGPRFRRFSRRARSRPRSPMAVTRRFQRRA